METAKLRIKLGQMELEYEGSQNYIETGILELIEQLSAVEIQDIEVKEQPSAPEDLAGSAAGMPPNTAKLSTTDFAVKLGVKSGTELVMAAAAYLHHTRSLEEFRRADILSEMKGAKAFFRQSYGSNLSKSLETLTKSGKLQNPKADTYALPYSEIERTKMLLN